MRDKQLVTASWLNTWRSSFRYTLRAVIKEKKETFIGFTSLTFIVFLATLTCVFYENSPQFFYLAARDSLGDADIMVLPKLESYSIP